MCCFLMGLFTNDTFYTSSTAFTKTGWICVLNTWKPHTHCFCTLEFQSRNSVCVCALSQAHTHTHFKHTYMHTYTHTHTIHRHTHIHKHTQLHMHTFIYIIYISSCGFCFVVALFANAQLLFEMSQTLLCVLELCVEQKVHLVNEHRTSKEKC